MEFAKYVASLRKKKGMTQKELADALGFTPQGISRFESLDSSFDLSLIPTLCKTLDCSLMDIYQRAEEPSYAPFPFDTTLVGENILKLREKAKMTQSALAQDAGITERSLRAYERGKALPSYQATERIAKALGVDLASLFVKAEEEEGEAAPPVKKYMFLWGAVSLGVTAVVLAIVLTLGGINGHWWDTSSSTRNDPSASRHTTQYVADYPYYLSASLERQSFSHIGDEIEFTLFDPEDTFAFDESSQYTFSFSPAEPSLNMEVECVSLGGGRAKAKLVSGKTGDIGFVHVTFDEHDYYDVFYLRYFTGEEVTTSGTGETFTEASITFTGQSVLTVKYSRSMSFEGQCFFLNDLNPVQYTAGYWHTDCKQFPSKVINSEAEYIGYSAPGYAHLFTITLPDPSKTSLTDVTCFFAVKVEDEEAGERLFFLSPGTIHAVR